MNGSGELARTLIARGHGLIDVYRLWSYPVVLGRGRRLFQEGAVPAALHLVATTATGTGVVVTTYRPAGEVRSGSFVPGRR
ncbi:dihydrofolate reductase family protein [Nocardiopsis ansamitocini]|uniref:Bacterial bifunctional deaminase-reductase C-terminal domain-containing protein n=1 Tax=Nocardiopsis ansamitocini TaxID=1670832 RepID=A0A9W6P4I7_9ACTN|nr:dihydrofolate reductase family protein [Nocardiopsis ansamitocini]GLU46962.1 hypothetical protein Nans01_13130 [Nocardiopsis ansamitocini]